MRMVLIAATVLSAALSSSQASALEVGDTMSAWSAASAKERVDVLSAILGQGVETGKVLQCMNETSKVHGHTDLPIAQVARACASPKNGDQPV